MPLEELKYLEKSITANPYNKDLAGKYIETYNKLKKHFEGDVSVVERPYKTKYLILNFFNSINKWEYLNLIGDDFLAENKYFISYLCYMESIRINPSQKSIHDKLMRYTYLSLPTYLNDGSDSNNIVSVIMGTYNRTLEIEESIRSVLNQTFQDFELIIINDGGTDAVESIVSSFRSDKIRYFKLNDNRGHAAVLNEGIRRARGKYICYLDDDDVYYRDHLERLYSFIVSSKSKFVYSNVKFVDGYMERGKFVSQKTRHIWDEEHDKNKLILDNYIANLCVIHEKSIFKDIGLFSEDLKMVMDWEFWLRASLVYDFRHLKNVTSEYRFNGNNVTLTDRLTVDFYTILIRNYYGYYKGLIPFIKYYNQLGITEDASRYFREIKGIYDKYFKYSMALEDLLNISLFYGDVEFINKVLADYFKIDTRNCIKYVLNKRSPHMYKVILPMMPFKILKAINKRVGWIAQQ